MVRTDDKAKLVLVLAPIGRDATASSQLLTRAGLTPRIVPDLPALLSALEVETGAVLVAEEALSGRELTALADWVAGQPPWSDLPFVILTSRQEQPTVAAWRTSLVERLRNVSLLERPVQVITLTSTVQAAVRARSRQFEVRDLLNQREASARELEQLVVNRTAALATANEDLKREMEERTRIEESLRQAQKLEAIGQLTGGVAHDFNNLLMVITGGLDILDRSDARRRARLMNGMRQAAQRGASLTRQLLAFSRRQALSPEAVDLARQIGGMSELLDRSLRGDVHVRLDLARDLWPVAADPGELELAVLNLAVNARDAMPNGGSITIRARNAPESIAPAASGEFVELRVIDTGAGMPEDVKARVFDPFFTTKDIGKGSGLGLAQVHGFATQSGGEVRIESAPGQGTEVILLLPRAALGAPLSERHLTSLPGEAPAAPGECGSVLLVEDDEEVAALVSEMLGQLGYHVTRAASAQSALGALANERSVDVVLSDIMMPGPMNGLDLARELRQRRPEMPVLLTSGYAGAARLEADAEGIPILAKPYGIGQLAAALRTVRDAEPV